MRNEVKSRPSTLLSPAPYQGGPTGWDRPGPAGVGRGMGDPWVRSRTSELQVPPTPALLGPTGPAPLYLDLSSSSGTLAAGYPVYPPYYPPGIPVPCTRLGPSHPLTVTTNPLLHRAGDHWDMHI